MPAVNKRESELKRPRSRKGGEDRPTILGTRKVAEIPEADESWHPIALGLYESARTSGQADYYQTSDWWSLYNLCEELSAYKQMGYSYIDKETGEEVFVKKRSGQMFTAITQAMKGLLFTEGDRLAVRMELTEPEKARPDLAVVAMDLYRDVSNG